MGSRRYEVVRHKDKWGFMHNIRSWTARPSRGFPSPEQCLLCSMPHYILVYLCVWHKHSWYAVSFLQAQACCLMPFGTKRVIFDQALKIYGYIRFVFYIKYCAKVLGTLLFLLQKMILSLLFISFQNIAFVLHMEIWSHHHWVCLLLPPRHLKKPICKAYLFKTEVFNRGSAANGGNQ